jgi:hypothetical protein
MKLKIFSTGMRVGLLSLLSLGLATTGCAVDAGSEAPPASSLADGLSVTEADAALGRLAGSFVHQGRLIHFEAVRGEENPAETQKDPDAPRFAVDARFTNSDGKTFILSGGGGEVARPNWAPEEDEGNPEDRTQDLMLLPKLADELEKLGAPSGLEYEFKKLVQLAAELRDMELVVKPTGDVPYACTTGYEHDMIIRYKAAFDLPIGHHTAVRLNSWYLTSSCTWSYQGYQESCNHGTCATASTMRDWCVWPSPLRSYRWPAFQVYTAYGNGACSTYYNPLSTLGGHNCNDDTYFQGYNIRNNTYYAAATGPSSICTDGTRHSYAPSCTGSRGAP